MSRREQLADELYEALELGQLESLVELATELLDRSEDAQHRLFAALGLIEGGSPRRGIEVLEKLSPEPLDDEQREERAYGLGLGWFALGEPGRALEEFSVLQPAAPEDDAGRNWMTGLCHDHLGDRVQADLCFREAARLDPGGHPLPTAISADEALALVEETLGSLPEPVRLAMEEVAVVIDDLPPLEVIRSSEGSVHPDTLGLYSGHDLGGRSHFDPGGLPPVIHIFRRNLERFTLDRVTLEDEIRTTLLHEIGHHLGLGEEDVDALGLG